jgi:hypothetical protein
MASIDNFLLTHMYSKNPSACAGFLLSGWRDPRELTPSVIRLKPAIRDQVKSGHREWPKT